MTKKLFFFFSFRSNDLVICDSWFALQLFSLLNFLFVLINNSRQPAKRKISALLFFKPQSLANYFFFQLVFPTSTSYANFDETFVAMNRYWERIPWYMHILLKFTSLNVPFEANLNEKLLLIFFLFLLCFSFIVQTVKKKSSKQFYFFFCWWNREKST